MDYVPDFEWEMREGDPSDFYLDAHFQMDPAWPNLEHDNCYGRWTLDSNSVGQGDDTYGVVTISGSGGSSPRLVFEDNVMNSVSSYNPFPKVFTVTIKVDTNGWYNIQYGQ